MRSLLTADLPQYALDFLKRKAQKKARGDMTAEQEAAMIAAVLHMSAETASGFGAPLLHGDAWARAGIDDQHTSAAAPAPGQWERSSSSWASAGRREEMRRRRQGVP